MTSTGGVDAARLRTFIERIERLEEEKAGISGDIKDVYAEAKGTGYDVKTMRAIVRLRKIEREDRREQEELLDLYKHALGMLADLPLGEAAIEREASPRRKAVQRVQKARAEAADAEPTVSLNGKGAMPLGQFVKIANALESPVGRALAAGFIAGAKLDEERKAAAETPHDPLTGEVTNPAEARAFDGIANAETSAAVPAHEAGGAPLHSRGEPAPQSIPLPETDVRRLTERGWPEERATIATPAPYRVTDPAPRPAVVEDADLPAFLDRRTWVDGKPAGAGA